jgi:hypothetical protein
MQQDIFREAIEKAKKTASWEKLTPSQKEELITKHVRGIFETFGRQQREFMISLFRHQPLP